MAIYWNIPWLLESDFNEILSNDEKSGGPLRERKYLEDFRRVLDDCELKDFKVIGRHLPGTVQEEEFKSGRGLTDSLAIQNLNPYLTVQRPTI